MAKVILTIAPEDGMFFEDILSFKTDTYVGLYDNVHEHFMLVKKSYGYFEPYFIDKEYGSLQQLDDIVFNLCEEHITDVYGTASYEFELG